MPYASPSTWAGLLTIGVILFAENFFRGWNAIGVQSNPQPNDGQPNGAFYGTLHLDSQNQSRSSASTAHYRRVIEKRRNYHLITGQSVTKILLDEKNKRATSVQVCQANITPFEIRIFPNPVSS